LVVNWLNGDYWSWIEAGIAGQRPVQFQEMVIEIAGQIGGEKRMVMLRYRAAVNRKRDAES